MLGIRSTDWIGLAATLLLAGAIGYVLLGNDLRKMAALTEEQASLAVELDSLTDVVDTVAKGNEVLGALEGKISLLQEQMPASMEFDSFFRELTELSEKNGVSLTEVVPGEARPEEDCLALTVSFTAEAALEDFHRFLFDIKRLPRLSKVGRLALVATDDPGNCAISAALSIFARE